MTPFELFQYLVAAALGGMLLIVPISIFFAVLSGYITHKAATRATELYIKEEKNGRD